MDQRKKRHDDEPRTEARRRLKGRAKGNHDPGGNEIEERNIHCNQSRCISF